MPHLPNISMTPRNGLSYRLAQDASERSLAIQLMHRVFVEELGYTGMGPDQFEALATYCLVFHDGVAVATVRLIPDGPQGLPLDKHVDLSDVRSSGKRVGEVSRLAAIPEFRSRYVAADGLEFLFAVARALGVELLVADSFLHMAPLYARLGFKNVGVPFFDPTVSRQGDQPGVPNGQLMLMSLDGADAAD